MTNTEAITQLRGLPKIPAPHIDSRKVTTDVMVEPTVTLRASPRKVKARSAMDPAGPS